MEAPDEQRYEGRVSRLGEDQQPSELDLDAFVGPSRFD